MERVREGARFWGVVERFKHNTKDTQHQRDKIQDYWLANKFDVVSQKVLPNFYWPSGTRVKWQLTNLGNLIEEALEPGDIVCFHTFFRIAPTVQEAIKVFEAITERQATVHLASHGRAVTLDDVQKEIGVFLEARSVLGQSNLKEKRKAAARAEKVERHRRGLKRKSKLYRPKELKKAGRPAGSSKINKYRSQLRRWRRERKPATWMAQQLGVSRGTIYRWFERHTPVEEQPQEDPWDMACRVFGNNKE